MKMKKISPPQLKNVHLTDPVFSFRQKQHKKVTIPSVIAKTIETGRIDSFSLSWKEEDGLEKRPHYYWDSDVAKVMEGIACSLALEKDEKLEKLYDEWVKKICSAQQEDGYINTRITTIEKENRFKNLTYNHELYCAGHLMEAAVAGYEELGKKELLASLCRYADLLAGTFGKEEGKRRGWPGHEEIELALAKMYRATRKEEYLSLMRYFINDRGTSPNFFTEEGFATPTGIAMLQADKPVRELKEAFGHAVRAVYLFCGMADLALLDQDESLLESCKCLYENITEKRMYITGGIGSSFHSECFTKDYDLANGSLMYAESCAAMGLAFFAHRMFLMTGENKYMDTVERCLYNGILSGISLQGDRFFYTNYLEVDDNLYTYNSGAKTRKEWFSCSCCPTSYARLIPQIGKFIYAVEEEENAVLLNIPVSGHGELLLHEKKILLDVEGKYPYDGNIRIRIGTEGEYTLKIRIPDWCRKYEIKVNGEAYPVSVIERSWKEGDKVELFLDMPVRFVFANSHVTGNNGRCAIMRGPLVYALEELDQTCPVRELILPLDQTLELLPLPSSFPEEVEGIAISGKIWHEKRESTSLYTEEKSSLTETKFLAVPYALWQNRGETNMAVWMRYLVK